MDAKHTLGEPRALISRAALLHNAGIIRRALQPSTKICAIIKADAYGHGANIVVDTLCNFSGNGSVAPAVDALAVASIDEAASLPTCDLPVIIFRPVENAFIGRQRSKIDFAIRCGWTLTLCSAAAANDVARIALSAGARASVQVMIDTGMSRSGVSVAELENLLRTIDAHPSLKLSGTCSHFAMSEFPDDSFTQTQLARFTELMSRHTLGRTITRHLANSAAVFLMPTSHFDMVRPGLALYGIDPTCRPSMDRPLRPVLTWTAPLLSIRELKKGSSVGYGQSWQAKRDARIGLVPVGYADGYFRCLGNRAVMMVNGRPAPVVGRVSMDLVTIDLTDITATVGDEATVIDNDPLSPASVYALAKHADTIPYEILCGIGPRIARVAADGDERISGSDIDVADETSELL